MLTGPDEETAGWIGRRLVGRTHKGKTVTRADVMHGLNVIHTITLDDVFPLHQADPTRPAATVAAVE